MYKIIEIDMNKIYARGSKTSRFPRDTFTAKVLENFP